MYVWDREISEEEYRVRWCGGWLLVLDSMSRGARIHADKRQKNEPRAHANTSSNFAGTQQKGRSYSIALFVDD